MQDPVLRGPFNDVFEDIVMLTGHRIGTDGECPDGKHLRECQRHIQNPFVTLTAKTRALGWSFRRVYPAIGPFSHP